MKPVIDSHTIICSLCGFRFDQCDELKHCSNCYVCSGCEIYYCPQCDAELVVKPIKTLKNLQDHKPDPRRQSAGKA